jgi:hypothetical protein
MLVGHVGLKEVLVAELLVAQFAVGLDIKDLDPAAGAGGRSETGLGLHHAVAVAAVDCHPREGKHEVWRHAELLRQLLLLLLSRKEGVTSSC